MQKYLPNSWPIDALPRRETSVPGRDLAYIIASPSSFVESSQIYANNRISDEDMLIRGIEDPRYTPFGNLD